MEWKTIKKHAYAYMYGIEDRLCEKLKEKIRASLERQLDILMERALYTTSQMDPHDGPTIDLSPAEYRVIRERGADVYGRRWAADDLAYRGLLPTTRVAGVVSCADS